MILGIITIIVILAVIFFLSISFYICIFGGGPFVPTPFLAVHKILKQAKIKKGEKVYDIGAGDGRFVHFAAKKYEADAVGFEIDPFVFFLAKLRQLFWGWKGKIVFGSFLKRDISDADVVLCYMLPRTLKKFQKKFKKTLRPGTRIISYAFHIGNLKAKKIIPKNKKLSKIFIYRI